MAGKGGGAWKVAYADFVTAMMAFFLVMWICSQDQKFRQAVARYFNNPSGIGSFGNSKVPFRPGSLLDTSNGGATTCTWSQDSSGGVLLDIDTTQPPLRLVDDQVLSTKVIPRLR